MAVHNFKELKIWQESMKMVKDIYTTTAEFPQMEKFGLSSQMNRSAISIPSNIAEGSARGSDKEFIRFLSISLGSAYELETQVILAANLEFIKAERMEKLTKELTMIQRKIFRFKESLKEIEIKK